MTDQHEPDDRDLDDVLELIDSRDALPKVIIERNGRALDTALGAGKLPPEIRNIGRELPAAGDTAPVARTVPAEHSSTVTLQQAVEQIRYQYRNMAQATSCRSSCWGIQGCRCCR